MPRRRQAGARRRRPTTQASSVVRLKQVRQVATRYDKRARNYLAWVTLAAAVIWL